MALNSRNLLKVARTLVRASEDSGDAFLRRAQSSVYYAIFHCLACECADMMIGTDSTTRSNKAWNQVYRALEHKEAAKRCKDKDFTAKFGQNIQDFANLFHALQDKRHSADYDVSTSQLLKSSVEQDIALAETAINVLAEAPEKDRRAFCAYILFNQRPHPSNPQATRSSRAN